MSEGKVDAEIVRKLCIKDTSLIDQVELIDVSSLDLDDTNSWLYVPTGYQTESTVYNFYTWLKSEPELTLSANRKSIDTRTFTRPKKRPSRTNFESVFETSPHATNRWKTACSDFSNVEENLCKYEDLPTSGKEEAVPPTLKMLPTASACVLSDESVAALSEQSMEAFFNMSDSKGIDSFINLMEPGVNDSLMKVSQPSIFYSSIISLPRDESLHNTDCDKEEEPANIQPRTYSQQANQHEESKSLNVNETFSMGEADNNESYCLDPINRTFTNESYTIEKMELNETYNTELGSKPLTGLDKDKCDKIHLSSIFVNRDNGNMNPSQLRNNGRKELYNLDVTYLSTSQNIKNSPILDATYSATATELTNKDESCIVETVTRKDENQACDLEKNTAFNIPRNLIENESEASKEDSFMYCNALDSTFKLPIPLCNQSTPKNLDTLNSTFKTTNKHFEQSRIYNTALSSNFKAPTSLRRELLAEIHRSGGDHRLDCTFNHSGNDVRDGKMKEEIVNETLVQNVKNDIPVENKYNTYKKEPSTNRVESQVEVISKVGVCVQNSPDRKYYTFTRKAGAHGGKTDMENTESIENVDATFVKPFPKLQKRKQHIPRMLSKLPQFLQKSNPNLVSNSLKAVNVTECTNASGIRYVKGSQPNIVRDVEKNLANKLYPLGKMKSGSEQRLLELNAGVGELQMMGAGGSTESIESTQSAHSAPDLDDRLSTCSDSSHNSYTVQPMNIEQLHRIVQMQEESLKQDVAPPLNKRVLENTWVDEKKNLPSPILKNGIDDCERDSPLPLSMDYTVKTSSPILSPSRSSQSINTDGHSDENPFKQQNELDMEEKVEVSNKSVTKIENKTRLRQPTNWNTGNRASNLMSAIPRPPSRIPAPRFVRSTIKNTQGDVKKGYM